MARPRRIDRRLVESAQRVLRQTKDLREFRQARSKELRIPENIRLHRLPGYSPELNPQEHVWDELREKEFPNRVFDSMEAVINHLEAGLPRLAAETKALKSSTAWPWIISLDLSDNWN